MRKNHTLILSLLFLISSLCLAYVFKTLMKPDGIMSYHPAEEEKHSPPMATEIHGVKIERNPSDSKLTELGVSTWPKYRGEPSKIPWTFKATETMYLLEGKVKVYVEGHEEESFEIGAGDLVVFPKGMKITWEVIETVNKHYSVEKEQKLNPEVS
ncbi:hypothetical protein SLE2022_237170 [Rubroshorea leprosula]